MAFGRLLRNDERQKDRHRFAIGRIEGNRQLRSHEHAGRGVALRHARVRNRDAVTQTRRAQLLACREALQNVRFREALTARKQQRRSVASSRALSGTSTSNWMSSTPNSSPTGFISLNLAAFSTRIAEPVVQGEARASSSSLSLAS